MSLTLGEKLRAAREERGISISEVAEQTRIAPMYLECIENNDYKPLPGGIFNKGFVKSYARFVGFDEHEALQDYSRLAAQAEAVEDEKYRSYRPEVLTDDQARPSTIPTIIFAGIILALMTGGILFLVNYIQREPTPAAVPSNASIVSNSANGQQAETPPSQPSVPTMQMLKVEFRSTSEPISLSATSDGKSSVNTVTPGSSLIFEPKESLKLGYSRSLVSTAQLFINGRQIALPSAPANPKRVAIEIEINQDNLAQIWESGQIQFGVPTAANANVGTPQATQASPTPAANRPEPANLATPTPKPVVPTPAASPVKTPAAVNSGTPARTPVPRASNRAATAPKPTP